jgi:cytochrome c oxidase subunit 1
MPLWRRIFSTDHRVIGKQYFFLSLVAVLIGTALSLLMRFHLVHPAAAVSWLQIIWPTGAAGGVMTPELYLSLMTLHGTLMIFFVLTLAPQSAFGNLFLPAQLGAREMAFPVLNMLSFWTTCLSLAILIASFLVQGGGPLSGWTAYPPLSATGALAGPGEGLGQTLWFISITVFCVASLMGAINFIATVADLRAPGMTLMRMPLTCWSWFVTAILVLLAFSVLLPACGLILLDRLAGTSFFLPAGLVVGDQALAHQGGSPLLWQHLFWFFGHPEVYIAILPGMGIVTQLLANFARKPVFGYTAMVYSTLAIALIGLLVWGHHMFISGLSPYSVLAFSVLTLAIGVPSAVKMFGWLGTLWGGQLSLPVPMLFCLGFVSVFITGGLSGMVLGQPLMDQYFHDTYFVVAHFHMIMGVAALFSIFAATYYWFPLMFGRRMHEQLGKWHFALTFIGVHGIFLPMHLLGIAGNPRRYADFTSFEFLSPLMTLHQAITGFAYFTAAAQVLFLINLFGSMRSKTRAVANPWRATTLEWADAPVARVYCGPAEYGISGQRDFRMQHEAGSEAELN